MDENRSIYKKIFDLANGGMRKTGGEFGYGYEAFLTLIQANPNVVDVSEFEGLNMETYLIAVYLRCLNRLPDKNIYKMVDNLKNESRISQKYIILSTVIHSAEFSKLHKSVKGMKKMTYKWKKDKKYGIQQRLYVYIQSAKAKCFGNIVVPVWIRLPDCVKEVVRKLTGRKSRSE